VERMMKYDITEVKLLDILMLLYISHKFIINGLDDVKSIYIKLRQLLCAKLLRILHTIEHSKLINYYAISKSINYYWRHNGVCTVKILKTGVKELLDYDEVNKITNFKITIDKQCDL
jgi:hypothetical protein